METATLLIREQGLERLSMEGLAAHCGVNKALPYRHFANRDDLLVALFDRQNQQLDAALADATAELFGFEPKLRCLLQIWQASYMEGTVIPELLQARTQSGELESRRQVRMQIAVDYIASLIQESHEMSRSKAKLAAAVLLAGSQGLSAFWRISEIEPEELTESFVTMALAAVEAIAPAD